MHNLQTNRMITSSGHTLEAPKVSICIPVFNGEKYIREAVDSACEQEYSDFEIIIVDNCSTDGTAAIVEDIASQCEKVRFFKNKSNIGLAGNLNECLAHARGKYIKYLCVDDLLSPDCLSLMTTALDNDQTVSLVCCGRINVTETGQPFGLRRYSTDTLTISGCDAISRCVFGDNFIGEPTAVMFRNTDLLPRFRNDLPQLMDMEFWFRLLESGNLTSIGTPLCSIRFHDNQVTHTNIKSSKLIEDNIRIYSEFSTKPYLKFSTWMVFRHKLMMTFRVSRSRNFISPEYRNTVLSQYGIRSLFPMMPAVFHTMIITRKVSQFTNKLFRHNHRQL